MELPMIILCLIIILIIVIPLYYVMRSQKVDQNKINTVFAQYNENDQFNFKKYLTDKRKVLGLDFNQFALLFVDFNCNEHYVQFLNLEGIKSCQLHVVRDTANSNVLKKIFFIFDGTIENNCEREFIFYDSERQYNVPVYANEEYLIAQEWHKAICTLL